MSLRIRLLGRVGIDGDGRRIDAQELPGRQGRLVLAYLALHSHPVTRDELAELVWPGDLPRSWERDLSAVVSKLKRVFADLGAPDALEGALGCYELRLPTARVDVVEARRFGEDADQELDAGRIAHALGAAVACDHLARRPFLPADTGDWVDARREEMRALAGGAFCLEAHCYRLQGNLREALRYGLKAVEWEPYRENAYAQLMRAHLAAGDRAEALRVYERCRMRLLEDLGAVPGPEVVAVHREALG